MGRARQRGTLEERTQAAIAARIQHDYEHDRRVQDAWNKLTPEEKQKRLNQAKAEAQLLSILGI